MQINTIIFLELLNEVIHDAQVKIVAAEEGITARRADLEDSIAHIQNRDIKGTAAQIIDGNHFIFLFIESIGQGRGSWLVDDAKHFEACNLASVFGSIALCIVEISRNRNHCLRNG